MAILYEHISPSGKRYIGITSCDDPNDRWRSGRGYGDNTIFAKAIKKYGWNSFIHNIIKQDISLEDASILEKEYINKYQSNDIRFGYNMQDGGTIYQHSVETKNKISEKTKRALSNQNNPVHNKDKSWLDNISKSLIGKKMSKESVDKMIESKRQNGTLYPSESVINNLVKYNREHGAWNKGKHLTQITKDRISKSKTGIKVHTEEWKSELSEKMKGNKIACHPCSSESKSKLSKTFKNMKWMHNDCNEIRVPSEKVQEYLDIGYILGRRQIKCMHV